MGRKRIAVKDLKSFSNHNKKIKKCHRFTDYFKSKQQFHLLTKISKFEK